MPTNPDLLSHETTIKAITESSRPMAGLTGKDRYAQMIREKKAGEGSRSLLESMDVKPIPEKSKTDKFLKENFYQELDKDGKRIRPHGSESQKRLEGHDGAIEKEAVARAYVEKGYEGLSPAQKNDAIRYAREALFEHPDINAHLIKMYPDEMDRLDAARRIVADYLSHPDTKQMAQNLFSGVFDRENIPQIEDRLKLRFERAKEVREERREESRKNAEDRVNVGNELDKYRDITTPGTKGYQLEQKKRELPDLTKERDAYVQGYKREQNRIAYLREREKITSLTPDERKEIQDELKVLEAKEPTWETEIAARNERIKEAQDLQSELDNLKQRKQELDAERERIARDLATAESEYADANAEYAHNVSQHEKFEQETVEGLKNVFKTATWEHLKNEIRAAESARNEIAEKEAEDAKNATDPVQTEGYKRLEERYVRMRGKKREMDKDMVNFDYDMLMREGPDALLVQLLRGTGTPPMTRAEAQAKIADPNFKDAKNTLQNQMLERLIQNKVQTGQLNEGDVRFIVDSPWGAGLIERALDKNQDLEKTLKDLEARGAMESRTNWLDSIREMAKDKTKGNVLRILIMLLFGGAVGAVLAPASLPYVVGSMAPIAASATAEGAVIGAGLGAGAAILGRKK